MKLTKTMLFITAVSLCAGAMALPAFAAVYDTGESGATVTFVENNEGGKDPLRLAKVPDFNFGQNMVNANTIKYTNQTAGADLEVMDLRGSGAGWHVTAQISEPFTHTDDSLLTGSAIYLNSSDVEYAGTTTANLAAPTHSANAILNNTGEPVNVLEAADNRGMGHWADRLATSQLEVPGGIAKVGAYTAEVLWTLNDTPTGNG